MRLQDVADSEISALIERILERRSAAWSTQLRLIHDALDAAGRELETPAAFDREVHELSERLTGSFSAVAARMKEEARAALDAVNRDLAAERAARASLEETVTRHAEREATLEQELQRVRQTLDESLSEVASLAAQLEEMAGEKGRLGIDLSAAQGELQMVQAQHRAVVAQLKASTARANMFGRSQEETIEELQAQLDTAREGMADGEPDARPARPAPAAPGSGLDAAADDRLTSVVEAAVRSVEQLTRATKVADLLGDLARELSTEFSRVAIFRVEGNRLQGEHQVGFDYTTDVRKIAIPLDVESMLTRVVRTRDAERLSASDMADESKGAPFRGRPTLALALPILLHGEAVAVTYLDDWDQPHAAPGRGSDESSALFARLVIRHAGVLFIGFAHEVRMLKELREYASMLVEGAKQIYAADTEARMTAEAVRDRLADNLTCARQLFANRAALEGPAAGALLDQQLEGAIEADPSSQFARDLAMIAVRARAAEAGRSAQAS